MDRLYLILKSKKLRGKIHYITTPLSSHFSIFFLNILETPHALQVFYKPHQGTHQHPQKRANPNLTNMLTVEEWTNIPAASSFPSFPNLIPYLSKRLPTSSSSTSHCTTYFLLMICQKRNPNAQTQQHSPTMKITFFLCLLLNNHQARQLQPHLSIPWRWMPALDLSTYTNTSV